jgi:predicted nucleic acid-binding protein
MTLTYVDSDVLMWAARGTEDLAMRAMAILDDPDRSFASSVFSKLETLPKPTYHKVDHEAEFYAAFFTSCELWADVSAELCEAALAEGIRYGLSAIDSLHIISAARVGAAELVTGEKPTKSIHRTKLVRVVSLRSE